MKLSLVIPVLNEEQALPFTLARLRSVLAEMDCEHEIFFVNDGSTDGTSGILAAESAGDRRIKVIHFSRNFGHQAAVTAGLDFATGDAVVIMDADLQDPPELLPAMIALYREGYDVVSPQRISRKGISFFNRKAAELFYRVIGIISDTPVSREVGDFRLLSRPAVMAIRQFRERYRFMRGMVGWLGLREAFVPFERPARVAGESKYPFWKMIRFSWTAITSFSAMPLRMTLALGLVAVGFAFCYLVYALTVALVLKSVVSGWTSLVFLQCLFFGVTLICVGLTGEYVAKIYEQSKGRPLYVVSRALNVSLPVERAGIIVIEPRNDDTIGQ